MILVGSSCFVSVDTSNIQSTEGLMMLRFKGQDQDSVIDVLESHASERGDKIRALYEEIVTEDACKDLPHLLEKESGVEMDLATCYKTLARDINTYSIDGMRRLVRATFYDTTTTKRTPLNKIAARFEYEYRESLFMLKMHMMTKFCRSSDRYMDAFNEFITRCKSLSSTDPIREFSDYDRRSKELNSLLENKSLSAWQDVFENSNWSDAAILCRIDDVLLESIYGMLRQANGELDKTIEIVLQSVYKNFFMDTLADELREVAIDNLEMNDDLKSLLRTVNDVVDNTARRLEGEIVQRVEDLVWPMIDEYQAESM